MNSVSYSVFQNFNEKQNERNNRFWDIYILHKFISILVFVHSSLAEVAACFFDVTHWQNFELNSFLRLLSLFRYLRHSLSLLHHDGCTSDLPRHISKCPGIYEDWIRCHSPVFAGFDELLKGIIHICAIGIESRYQDPFYARVRNVRSLSMQLSICTKSIIG